MIHADVTITSNDRDELERIRQAVADACETPYVSAVEPVSERPDFWQLQIKIELISDLSPFFEAVGAYLRQWWDEQQSSTMNLSYHEGEERPWNLVVSL